MSPCTVIPSTEPDAPPTITLFEYKSPLALMFPPTVKPIEFTLCGTAPIPKWASFVSKINPV